MSTYIRETTLAKNDFFYGQRLNVPFYEIELYDWLIVVFLVLPFYFKLKTQFSVELGTLRGHGQEVKRWTCIINIIISRSFMSPNPGVFLIEVSTRIFNIPELTQYIFFLFQDCSKR